MRLILSRKGFDSKYGGCPSPILPDGTMFSMPITSDSGPHRLGQLNRDDLNFGDIARDLTQDRREASKRWGRGTGVHLDPDLDASVLRERARLDAFLRNGTACADAFEKRTRRRERYLPIFRMVSAR